MYQGSVKGQHRTKNKLNLLTGNAPLLAIIISVLYLGLSIAAPFYVAGLVLNVGMGLANRMMASLQVFFIAQPLLIAAGLALMVLAVPTMMRGFLEPFAEWLTTYGF